jgi:putative hydrolase of the HAD superfamily
VVEAIRRCRARLKTGLLTNNFSPITTDDEADARRSARPEVGAVLDLFDVVVESSRVGHRKPDPRFYELACELLAIEPDEAVFLDDLGVNLKPAKAMGMTTIKVIDPNEALRELESIVGFSLLESSPLASA